MIVNADELDYAVDEEIIVFSENVDDAQSKISISNKKLLVLVLYQVNLILLKFM